MTDKTTGKTHYTQPFLTDVWEVTEQAVTDNPNLHKVAYTIRFTLTETIRLSKLISPALGAYNVIRKALHGIDKDLVLVLEETNDRTTGQLMLHAHGYMVTSKQNTAAIVQSLLEQAAATGSKIRQDRGVHCKDTFNHYTRLTIGWNHYITKDLGKPFKLCAPDATRLAINKPLRNRATNYRAKLVNEFDTAQKAAALVDLINSMPLDKTAANDALHVMGNNSAA